MPSAEATPPLPEPRPRLAPRSQPRPPGSALPPAAVAGNGSRGRPHAPPPAHWPPAPSRRRGDGALTLRMVPGPSGRAPRRRHQGEAAGRAAVHGGPGAPRCPRPHTRAPRRTSLRAAGGLRGGGARGGPGARGWAGLRSAGTSRLRGSSSPAALSPPSRAAAPLSYSSSSRRAGEEVAPGGRPVPHSAPPAPDRVERWCEPCGERGLSSKRELVENCGGSSHFLKSTAVLPLDGRVAR